MGCLNNFVSPSKLLDSGELEECDIIEFNRITYSHFGFYIGNGVCVNVTGPNNQRGGSLSSSSSSSSSKFPKGMKQAERLLDIAGYDTRYNKVRVNNCVMLATTLQQRQRPKREAIELALKGLDRGSDGKVILEKPISYKYDLVLDNCEHFATRSRYQGKGFSVQAANPSINSTLGTVERLTSAIRHDLAEKVMDEDEHLLVRGAAAVGYGVETAAGWTAYAAKTTTDALAGAASHVLGIFR